MRISILKYYNFINFKYFRFGSQAHNNAIFDLTWMLDQMKLVTASGDHTSKLYDVSNGEIREEKVFCGHTRSVKTVAFRKDDSSVFATGGRDGNIILWDIRTDTGSFIGKADRTIPNSHLSKITTPNKPRRKFGTPTNSGIKSVTGLVFQEGNTLISCGAGDGLIKIWDLRKNYNNYKKEAIPKNIIAYPGSTTKNGYSSLLVDNSGIKLYANCLDNTIYCYNIGTYNNEPVMKYFGHQNSTFYVKSSICKTDDYLISGSSDENAYIWNTKYSYPVVKLTGHTAEVTCVAWCSINNCLITCSDDMTHMIWNVGPEYPSDDLEINLSGRAQIVPIEKCSNISLLKRNMKHIGECTPKKFFIECEKCTNPTVSQFCENCYVSSKRKNVFDLQRENKITRTEFGPRRLFANTNCSSQSSATNTLDHSLATSELDDSPTKKRKLSKNTTVEINNSSIASNVCNSDSLDTNYLTDDVDYEPQKKLVKVEISSKSSKTLLSPTVNLPNYIIDGTAPHLHFSPPKKKSQDWLTQLRTEKLLRQEMIERTIGDTPKLIRLDCSPKGKRYAPKSPLLRYFRVTNSTQKCDGVVNCSKHNRSNFLSLGIKENDN